jgi:ABC-type cobalt transport system substrate-binding protein
LENDVEEEDWMKRAIFLATAALLVMLVLAPVALAQDTTMMGAETQAGGGATQAGGGATQAGGGTAGKAGKPLPPSGGPEILLPAAALLLGSGVLTYAVLRRR